MKSLRSITTVQALLLVGAFTILTSSTFAGNNIDPLENALLKKEWTSLFGKSADALSVTKSKTSVDVIFTVDPLGRVKVLNAQSLDKETRQFVVEHLDGWQSEGVLTTGGLYRISIRFTRL